MLSQFSIILLYLSFYIKRIFFGSFSKIKNNKLNYNLSFIIALVLFIIIFTIFNWNIIFWKLNTYVLNNNNKSYQITNYGPLFILTTWSIFYTKNILKSIMIFLPFIIGFLFIGGSRINMLAYLVFLGVVMPVNRGLNNAVFITSSYFFYKSILFIDNIIKFGHGFPE